MPELTQEKKILVELTAGDAILFQEFQRRYEVIAPLVGYMDSLKVLDLRNMSLQFDIDKNGVISHTSITRHFRPV